MATFEKLMAERQGDAKTDFSGVDIFEQFLDNQQLVNCLFNGTHFRKTTGQRLDCRHVEFSDSVFEDCTFEKCHFDHSDFVNTSLTRCVFRNCTFRNGEWRSARLVEVIFETCDFADATVNLCGLTKCSLGRGFLSPDSSHGKRYNVLLDCMIDDDSSNDAFTVRNLIFEHDQLGSPILCGNEVARSTLGIVLFIVDRARSSLACSPGNRESKLLLRQLVLAGDLLVTSRVLPLIGAEYLATELVRSIGPKANTEAFLEIVKLIALCRSELADASLLLDRAVDSLVDLEASEIATELHFDRTFGRTEIDQFVVAVLRISGGSLSLVRQVDIRHGSTILTLVISGVLGVAALVKAITFLLARTDTLIEQATKLRKRLGPKRPTRKRQTVRKRKPKATNLAVKTRELVAASESDPYLKRLHSVVVELGSAPLRIDGNVVIRISIEQDIDRISVK